MTRILQPWVLAPLLMGCSPIPSYYPDINRQDWTDYQFQLTYTSPDGIQADDPRHELSVAGLDATTANVNKCLAGLAPLTLRERAAAYCYGSPRYNIRPGLRVIVPPDWRISACSGKELFPCSVPIASCEAKGETPTAQCPCSCRAIVQLNSEVVTAPDLELYPWRLVELATGCEQQEYVPRLAACGSPDQRASP